MFWPTWRAAGLAFFRFSETKLGLVAETDPVAGLSGLCKVLWLDNAVCEHLFREASGTTFIASAGIIGFRSEIGPAIPHPDGSEITRMARAHSGAVDEDRRQSLTAEAVLACEDGAARCGLRHHQAARMLNKRCHEIVGDDPDPRARFPIRPVAGRRPAEPGIISNRLPQNGEMRRQWAKIG